MLFTYEGITGFTTYARRRAIQDTKTVFSWATRHAVEDTKATYEVATSTQAKEVYKATGLVMLELAGFVAATVAEILVEVALASASGIAQLAQFGINGLDDFVQAQIGDNQVISQVIPEVAIQDLEPTEVVALEELWPADVVVIEEEDGGHLVARKALPADTGRSDVMFHKASYLTNVGETFQLFPMMQRPLEGDAMANWAVQTQATLLPAPEFTTEYTLDPQDVQEVQERNEQFIESSIRTSYPFEPLTVKQLRTLAESAALKIAARMRKKDLINRLRKS
jgi:hypothetical protein